MSARHTEDARRGLDLARAAGEPVFLPGEGLGLAAALTAHTAGSAYVNHLDDSGRVAVGALADLVVLDRDPFTGAPEALAERRVALTHVRGARVYAAGQAQPAPRSTAGQASTPCGVRT
ncbi:amidohydrolase family protein [Streptomyces sp. NPDC048362]|uniref:amidohydrolase family protein n=1 Tax=Streptomyces sp. NPDC048362 TaxID=3365539 RepID=UPI0037238E9E